MEKLVSKRSGHKGRITTLIAKSNEEIAKTNPSSENLSCYQLEIVRQQETVLSLDAQIQESSADLAKDIDESSDHQMKVNLILSKIAKCLAPTQNPPSESRQSSENRSLGRRV